MGHGRRGGKASDDLANWRRIVARVSWTWRLENSDGTPVAGRSSPAHASQSDAESWLGETWRSLADAGVAQVSLLNDGERVYGPMPLTE
jgi:hypothetical protein